MPNRTTVKSNIQGLNVPTVSNADMNQMLQTNICDNVVFKEDVGVNQYSSVNAITCDFTGKDRINLTRTGGSLQITLAGVVDGDRVFLLINKTAGQPITWVSVTDITPVLANVTAATTVVYEIIRKGSYYFANAIIKSPLYATDTVEGIIRIATQAEVDALSSATLAVTPTRLPRGSAVQVGMFEAATNTETDAGTDSAGTGRPLVVIPSQLKRKLDNLTDGPTHLTLTLSSGWSGTVQYGKDLAGNVFIRTENLERATALSGTVGSSFATLPSGYLPTGDLKFVVSSEDDSFVRRIHCLSFNNAFDTLAIIPEPDDYPATALIQFYIMFKEA